MIGQLRGTVTASDVHSLILDVHGVGYRVFTTDTVLNSLVTSDEPKKEVCLWIHTAMRENAIELFGFFSERDLHVFEKLLSVSGIGPRTALNIIGIAPVASLVSAIVAEDSSLLTSVSGIGKKNAQKIVLELHDKFEGFLAESEKDNLMQGELDALAALEALGYPAHQARSILKEIDKTLSTQERIREALRFLGK